MRNHKRLLASILLLGGFSVSLASCKYDPFGLFTSSSQSRNTEYNRSDADQPSSTPKATRSVINRADASCGVRSLPSQGTVNILVVPVCFTDFESSANLNLNFGDGETLSRMSGFDDDEGWRLGSTSFRVDWLDDIEKAFFGDPDDTGYESVSSFYEKSSYGKLHISGVVSPVFYTLKTYDQIINQIRSEGSKAVTDEIAEDIYRVFFQEDKIYDVDDFDSDDDGVVDGIWMVYDLPDYSSDPSRQMDSDLMWAYTAWAGEDEMPGDLGISGYCWASKWFITNGLYAEKPYVSSSGHLLPDSHTYIHETGHLLGLNDYYDTSSEYMRCPAAGLTMMDHNVFDLDPYSKYLFGWVNPKQYWADDLEDPETITLRPFESSGDCVVLNLPGNSGWVGEEYVILAYWTPTGLNEIDATNPYMVRAYTDEYTGLTKPGIMAYHVDSRFLKLVSRGGLWTEGGVATEREVMNATPDSYSTAYQLAYSNDTGTETSDDDVQIEMIDATNLYEHMSIPVFSDTVINPTANDYYLFHQGDVYDSSYLGSRRYFFASFHGADSMTTGFNDYNLTTGLRVTFGKQNTSGATLTIEVE